MLKNTEILIVEDSLTQALQLQALLEENHASVVVASNGEEALKLVSDHPPTLIISDIMMPKMDGYTLCKHLKNNPETEAIPVILVTTLTDPQDVIQGLLCGADNFIRKPYDEEYLMSRIQYFMANIRHREHDRVKMGVEVILGGKRHFITSARQQILDLLISTYEEGIRLNRELKSKHQQLTRSNTLINSLFHFTADLSGATNEHEIIERALSQVKEFPDADSVWLLMPDDIDWNNPWRLMGFKGPQVNKDTLARCHPQCPCTHAMHSDQLSEAINIQGCPALDGVSEQQAHATIPLKLGNEIIGILNVTNETGEPWDSESMKPLISIGHQFSVALGRARLYDSLEALVEQRTSALVAEMEEKESAQNALTRSEALLRTILETLPVGVCVAQSNGEILLYNNEMEHLWERHDFTTIHSLTNKDCWWESTGKSLVPDEWPLVETLEDGHPSLNKVIGVRSENEEPNRTLLVSAVPLLDNNKQQSGVIGVFQDISMQRQVEQELILRTRAVEASINAVVITDTSLPDNPIVYVNPAFERITGYRKEEALGKNCRFLQNDDRNQLGIASIRRAIDSGDKGGALLRNYRKDGSLFWNDLQIAPVRDQAGNISHYVGVVNDVTETKRYQEQLEYKSNYDEVTGLPNRNLLMDRIQRAIANAARHKNGFALAVIDLDNFKLVNDTLGHDIGDRLLKNIVSIFKSCVRTADTLARLGGDEFVLLLNEESDLDSITTVLQRILLRVAQPQILDNKEHVITTSIGFCMYPSDGQDATALLKNADTAMYQAKNRGKNRICSFTKDMNASIQKRMSLERFLRQGIEQNELMLYYQPQLSPASRRTAGLEALVRWQRDDRIISPLEFIPIAEETGLILQIDAWVLRTACQQAISWREQNLPPITVSVNLSSRQFQDANCVPLIKQIFEETSMDPSLLKIEITESMVMANVDQAIKTMKQIKDMGIKLSMDDFGTGYSSLGYLKRFPFDQIKIDKSFVEQVTSDPQSAAIVKAVISLSKTLGMQIVAEGVETPEQYNFLVRTGCDLIQGYFYSPPLPVEACKHFVLEDQPWGTSEESVLAQPESRTLLVIDDDINILRSIKRELRYEPYQILTADNPTDAFALLAKHDVKVVMADQRMGEMNGTEFLRRVKDIHPEAVRIVMSGYTDLNTVLGAINEGSIFRFICKPWEPEHLRENMKQAFREHDLVRENQQLRQQLAQLSGNNG
ncbi:PAS domain S-box protein [Hahella sp. CCB-MM4]|uniref:EAL domain-containing protein n=1 Tax=Hahella sp. (strain CCB-MM4) TaxID=1926491 RepID=UPI000B9AE268|nr:EAL domain-containing protein [Hahella sp. CCB-MM4]OZG71147.1 PAS domain S-box protein [Hahella sp. CCB-MM4]